MSSIENNILNGPKSCFKPYIRGLGEFLFDAIGKHGDRTFLINADTEDQETYDSLRLRSTRLAINLRKRGVTSQHTILSWCEQGSHNVVPFLSTLYLGAKCILPNTADTIENIRKVIILSKPDFMFADEKRIKEIEKCLGDVETKPTIFVIGHSDEYTTLNDLLENTNEENTFEPAKIEDVHDVAVVLFTSGTTGNPKGVCYSHWALTNLAVCFLGYEVPEFKSTNFSSADPHWISGITFTIFNIHLGNRIVLYSKVDPEPLMEIIEKYKINYMSLQTCYIQKFIYLENIHKYDYSSLKRLVCSSEHVHSQLLIDLRAIFKDTFVHQGYGASENGGGNIIFNHGSPLMNRVEALGEAQIDTQVKVVDRVTGKPLGPNQKGEICIKNHYQMMGYYNQPDMNPFDQDGFIGSGDLGYYDEDGCVYFLSRLSEIIPTENGEVYPPVVEKYLKNHPAIQDAGVCGLSGNGGSRIGACVVLGKNKHLSENDLSEYLKQKFVDLDVRVIIAEKLPRYGGNNKLKRPELVNLFPK